MLLLLSDITGLFLSELFRDSTLSGLVGVTLSLFLSLEKVDLVLSVDLLTTIAKSTTLLIKSYNTSEILDLLSESPIAGVLLPPGKS